MNAVKEAVKGELNCLGKLLGYSSMDLKIRQKKRTIRYNGSQVYDVMTDVDLEGLRQRQPRFKQKKGKRHNYCSWTKLGCIFGRSR